MVTDFPWKEIVFRGPMRKGEVISSPRVVFPEVVPSPVFALNREKVRGRRRSNPQKHRDRITWRTVINLRGCEPVNCGLSEHTELSCSGCDSKRKCFRDVKDHSPGCPLDRSPVSYFTTSVVLFVGSNRYAHPCEFLSASSSAANNCSCKSGSGFVRWGQIRDCPAWKSVDSSRD
jgi:hypothetical protein